MRRSASAGVLLAFVLSCGKGSNGGSADPAGGAGGGADEGAGLARAPDAGEPAVEPPLTLPTADGWTFYGVNEGAPHRPLAVSEDAGGNLWVAGGEEGLFLLRAGATSMERFTLASGLHPYGFPRPEEGAITRFYLNVTAVAGGPAGVAFVGYGGMPPGPGEYGCEDNFDGPTPDPNIYKSGDADRVRLTDGGLEVVHYDLSSGVDMVAAEPRGREKLCTVDRIVYDAPSKSVWFGANHGFAWGDPDYAGSPACFGQRQCSGVMEHAHPLLNGYATEASPSEFALTNDYFGLAVGPKGDVWVGGLFRSIHCTNGAAGDNFWDCEIQGTQPKYFFDWWPDPVPSDSRPSGRVDDAVSSMALAPDGTLWIGSFARGLAARAPDGKMRYVTTGLVDPARATAVGVDPLDASVWVGGGAGGLTRLRGNQFVPCGLDVLGNLTGEAVSDIQVAGSGSQRRILVAFLAGAIGIYRGP